MKTRLQRWGNSMAMRVPMTLVKEMGLSEGSSFTLEKQGDVLVLRPLTPAQQLQDLLEQITPENLHTEQWSDEAHGQESW